MSKYIYLLLCIFVSGCQWPDSSVNVWELELPEKCFKTGNQLQECQLYNSPDAHPSPLSINNAKTKDWDCQPFLKIDELMEPDSGYQNQLELGKELLTPINFGSLYFWDGFYTISLDLQCIPESEIEFVRYFVHLPEFPEKVHLQFPFDLDLGQTTVPNEQIKNPPYSVKFYTSEYYVHRLTHFAVITFKDGSELQSKDTSVHIDEKLELFKPYYNLPSLEAY